MMNLLSMIRKRLSTDKDKVPLGIRRNKKSDEFSFELNGEIFYLSFWYNWKNRRYIVDVNHGEMRFDLSDKEGETIKRFLYAILRY